MRSLLVVTLVSLFPAESMAEEAQVKDVKIDKKPGQEAGIAAATVYGKPRHIASEATAAWAAMGGENALVLVPAAQKEHHPNEYHLRLYEADVAKNLDLGLVPFAQAEFREIKREDGTWLFLLKTGNVTYVADEVAVRARLNESQAQSPRLAEMLGMDMLGIYAIPRQGHVNFLRDGSVVVVEPGDKIRRGHWLTDGESMLVSLDDGTKQTWPRSVLSRTAGVSAGTRMIVRLTQPLSSLTAKEGTKVEAVEIEPIFVDGRMVIPPHSKLSGSVIKARRVGWGVVRENASITLQFDTLELPNGKVHKIQTRMDQVENSREKVNEAGTINGIRSTATWGYTAKSRVASVAALDPVAYLFTSASGTAVLGFTEPEILYPGGTEFRAELTAPLLTDETFPTLVGPMTKSDADREALYAFVRKLSYRTATKGSNKPSDLTTLLFLGPPEGLRRAFRAAGWVDADALNAESTFQTLKSIAGDEGYNSAPMSTLTLDERAPIYNLSKTTNTFAARHHLRVFDLGQRYQGATALTSSATQDIGIAFSRKQKTFIHVIDEYIDNERSKVVNDLQFTGCLEGMELVPRPWVPRDAYNSTGDRLRTDGAIAVLRISECLNPNTTPTDDPKRPPMFQRGIRNTMLTLRNDIWRGNVAYQGVDGIQKLRKYLAKDKMLAPEHGAWRKADVSGEHYEGFGAIPEPASAPTGLINRPDIEPATTGPEIRGTTKAERWIPPRYEIALHGGYSRYTSPPETFTGISLISKDPSLPSLEVGLGDELRDGWNIGLSVTTNTWRWISSEFTYSITRGKYNLSGFAYDSNTAVEDVTLETEATGLATRQFDYTVLFHGRPRESRWRPYVVIGPALQLIHVTDSPLKRPNRGFRFGAQNIGLFKAAFDFGRTPPLDGGGVFQMGLVWGAGIKYRVHPRVTIRTDFRETWSKNPDMVRGSYTIDHVEDEDIPYGVNVVHLSSDSRFRQQRFTFGIAFTF